MISIKRADALPLPTYNAESRAIVRTIRNGVGCKTRFELGKPGKNFGAVV